VISIVDVSTILTTYIFNNLCLLLAYEWHPYLTTPQLSTVCGCLMKCVTAREHCMQIQYSLMRGVFRRHDSTNVTIYCKHFTVLYLIACSCVCVLICATQIHTMTSNMDDPVGLDRELALGLKKNGQYREEHSDKSMVFHFCGVGELSYFHLMNFTHMYQPICMRNSISFFNVSKRMRTRI
jgi:hypothetical protein